MSRVEGARADVCLRPLCVSAAFSVVFASRQCREGSGGGEARGGVRTEGATATACVVGCQSPPHESPVCPLPLNPPAHTNPSSRPYTCIPLPLPSQDTHCPCSVRTTPSPHTPFPSSSPRCFSPAPPCPHAPARPTTFLTYLTCPEPGAHADPTPTRLLPRSSPHTPLPLVS